MASHTWPIVLVIICALEISVLTRVKSYYGADKISKLPGQPNVNFQQYSGYITVDDVRNISLFYYFVEAETKPASKPLVLWLSGNYGPGCSSLGFGAFIDSGPFKPSGRTLVKHNYSWNKEANMIYLDAPAGTGFSYSEDELFYTYVNDEITAINNLNFLEKWIEKFPEFKSRELYITGEGYAGHFVPQQANLIVQSKSKLMNLRGISIGNPYLEFKTDFNSRAEYMWSHGLISDSTLQQLTYICNYSKIESQKLFHENLAAECSRVNKQASDEASSSVNRNSIDLDVCSSSVSVQSQALNQMQNEWNIDVCLQSETEVYFKRSDVQKALHARAAETIYEEYSLYTNISYYDLNYKRKDIVTPTIGLLGSLVNSGIRVLVYSADQEYYIPLTGTRKLVNGLAEKTLKRNTTRPYSAWFVKGQVAGWTQEYGELLSYATIRGASHDVSWSQPERALVFFTYFLNGKPLPPVNGTI
ncbi:hypothetical protein CASFOL_025555 [Castilleja foliolosa]|uniref:Carboxypeptidase n=1 Tax=Castilleja foliolosa TaxID=1961234 RepID=A0ABD3CRG7_9LAMI